MNMRYKKRLSWLNKILMSIYMTTSSGCINERIYELDYCSLRAGGCDGWIVNWLVVLVLLVIGSDAMHKLSIKLVLCMRE